MEREPGSFMTLVQEPREVVSRREPSCVNRLYLVLCSTAEDINDTMLEGAPWSLVVVSNSRHSVLHTSMRMF
jgi:hypothetical protein